MCAICGVFDPQGVTPEQVSLVTTIRDAMAHRGPDDAGDYHDAHVALGVRRLSIIDVAGGHQPIPNEDRTVWVALNGEIYNYRELRQDLETAGHRFTTQSDTEVLVHLYEERGERFLEALRGMFGLAAWDARRQRLILARDRLGIKPLYYTTVGTALWFASELKALLRHPAVSRDLDLTALDQYLCHEYVPAPRSIIRGIQKLPPGHRLTADAQEIRVERYWRLPRPGMLRIGRQEATARFRDLLQESVSLHLQSDVPVGVWLSGGLDSSAILAMASQVSGRILPAFTIGFGEASFDETASARAVATACGAEHVLHRMSVAEVFDVLDDAVAACDEPLGDSSLLPTWCVSRLARSRVTVALSGDGGDELSGGYPTYPAHRLARWYDRVPRFLRRGLIAPLVQRLPVSHANMSVDFLANRFLRGEDQRVVDRHFLWMGAFGAAERAALWAPDVWPDHRNGSSWDVAELNDPAEAAMQLDLLTYLPDDLLYKVDRASMAHGLEVRVPFLDHRVVEFAAQLPAALKLRGFRTKAFLRQALDGLVPPAILRRPKKGFGMPISAWLCGALQPLAAERLSSSHLARHGFWNPDYVGQLWHQHQRRIRNHGKLLWTLLMFELWYDRHLANAPEAVHE